MGTYVIRRLIQAIPLLVFISITVFLLLQAAPGGPLGAYVHRGNFSDEDLRRLEEQMGLHDPVYIQYIRWAGNVITLDFGDNPGDVG